MPPGPGVHRDEGIADRPPLERVGELQRQGLGDPTATRGSERPMPKVLRDDDIVCVESNVYSVSGSNTNW
jgi:hypothetical protein